MHRAVGGSWTEYLKTDEELLRLAGNHVSLADLPSIRACPFCRTTHGTPRHYVMECPETAIYAVEICDAVENELANLGHTQELIDASKKHFLDTSSSPPHSPSEQCVVRWPILSAWHWLVRIPAKESEINAVRSSGADTSEMESPLDLAYRCILPAPLGYAIHRMEVPPICEPVSEEFATLLDARGIANEAEGTAALWRSQRPAIMVVTTLALGLRKLRAEVRRRVEAWKTLAGSAAPFLHSSQAPSNELVAVSQPEDHLSPRLRCSFNVSFANWATSSGMLFISTLRGAIPPRDAAITRLRSAAPFARFVSKAKIEEALTNFGVPYTTSFGYSWGACYHDWKMARKLFHVPCQCDTPEASSSTILARCTRCHGYSLQGDIPFHAACKACGKSSDNVCAACHCGIHNMARCTVGYGVNKEYFPEASELFSVCPDCVWKCIQFLCSGPCRELPLHQTAALTTMTSNASSFSALHNNLRNFIKLFMLCNSASEITLTHALQGHRAFELPSLSVAMEKIDELIKSGHIEILNGICRWNDEPVVRAQNATDPTLSPAKASRKRSYSAYD